MVKATLSLMQAATNYPVSFDYYVMLSGTDYPIKSNTQIYKTLYGSKHEYVRHYQIPDYEVLECDNGGLDRIERFFMQDSILLNTKSGKSGVLNLASRVGNSVLWNLPVKRKFPLNLVPYWGWQHMILTHHCVAHILAYIRENPRYLSFFKFVHVADEIALQTIILNSTFRHRVVNTNLKYIDYRKSPHYVLTIHDLPLIEKSSALFARKIDPVASAKLLDVIDVMI